MTPASPAAIDPDATVESQNVAAAPIASAVVQNKSSETVPRPNTTWTAAPM